MESPSPSTARDAERQNAPSDPPSRPRPPGLAVAVGQSFSVEASGLDPERLAGVRGQRGLEALFADLIETLALHPVSAPIWHLFPGPHAGVTGIVALSESHLACHTFPEHGGLTLDLYTCRERHEPDWARLLVRHVGLAGAEPRLVVSQRRRTFGPEPTPHA